MKEKDDSTARRRVLAQFLAKENAISLCYLNIRKESDHPQHLRAASSSDAGVSLSPFFSLRLGLLHFTPLG